MVVELAEEEKEQSRVEITVFDLRKITGGLGL